MTGKKPLLAPLGFAGTLASLAWIPTVRDVPYAFWATLGAAAALALWSALLAAGRLRGRFELIVDLRKQGRDCGTRHRVAPRHGVPPRLAGCLRVTS
jgi:hypothetical protein